LQKSQAFPEMPRQLRKFLIFIHFLKIYQILENQMPTF
jgi:hypothetical protein